MRSASYQTSPDRRRGPLKQRAVALFLALAVHILGILMLVMLAPDQSRPPKSPAGPNTFRLLSLSDSQSAPKSTPRRERASASDKATRPPVRPPVPVATPTPPVTPPVPNMLVLSREEFAAADISKLPSNRNDQASNDSDGDSVAAYGPGEGPGGERLYNAEWYTEPSRTDLAFYLPPGGAKPGWGMIACQTVANYRVENCRQLGESPPGSGLSRALRQAAWQFRVRPPRIGGRPVIGAWVRIRFDFTEGKAE